MKTTLEINDQLITEAAKLANTDNQSQVIEMALNEFIKNHALKRTTPKILELYGTGGIRDDYDYQALRREDGK
ncbi:MAG: type II toxin-antitoxin system VapB family antitoxin [Methylobacter sp.]